MINDKKSIFKFTQIIYILIILMLFFTYGRGDDETAFIHIMLIVMVSFNGIVNLRILSILESKSS